MIVVADTSGLLAAADDRHSAHDAARAALDGAGTVVLSPVLLGELDHVGRRVLGRAAAHELIDELVRLAGVGRVVVPPLTAEVLASAQSVRMRYRDLALDLADAVNVVLAQVFRTHVMLTLDRRDVRTVRPLTSHAAFRLLPDDP